MKVAPSIIAADFTRLKKELTAVEKAGADLIHLDVMDGVFVPNFTFGPMIVETINRLTPLPLDTHLMIVRPENYLRQFIEAGADWISFHAEATTKLKYCIKLIKARHRKAGLAINPPTPLHRALEYLDRLDYLLIMGVNPGFYGQKFINATLKKVEQAKNCITRRGYKCLVEVDGGINRKNARILTDAGADILVAGAGVFKMNDYKKALADLKCSKVW